MKQEQLQRLFPEGVIVEVATDADGNEERLHPRERALMGAMIPARRREFSAGRNAARRVLARLGFPEALLLRRDADRDIAWPAGSTGSVSHTSGLCAVACARITPGLQSLGLDVEQAGPLGDDIAGRISRPDELAVVRALPLPGTSDWPRVLFCMKEAAYKAWYPVTRRVLEFQEMRIALDVAARCYEAEVDGAEAGLRITGRLGWDEKFVFAGAVLTTD